MLQKAIANVKIEYLNSVVSCLQKAEYAVTAVDTTDEVTALLSYAPYDLIVCQFCGENTNSICIEEIRSISYAPILGVIDSENYWLCGELLGQIDDCVLASCDSSEFIVRAKNLGMNHKRKEKDTDETKLCFNGFCFYLQERALVYNNAPITLTKTEYDILLLLASHPKKVFSRQQIFNSVWEDFTDIDYEKNISNHVQRIRKKLLSFTPHEYIQSEWGVGYKFVPHTQIDGEEKCRNMSK